MGDDSYEQLVERVRRALIERATMAHEDARLQGLCWEGAWEAAVSAMREFDLRAAAEAGAASAVDSTEEATGTAPPGAAGRRSEPLG